MVRATLFTSTAVAALAVGAYTSGLFDGLLPGGNRQAALEVPSEGTPPSGEAGGKSGRLDAPATDEPQAEPAAEPEVGAGEQAADAVAPSFDLVRVEPDGSILFAGNAAADASVDIISGSTVIGQAVAGPSGDFVAVLDKPLKPGDYEIVLRSTAGGVVAMSTETAIVSIPDTPQGEVLALVEAPGEASKLITVPSPPAASPSEQASAGKAGPEPVQDTARASGDAADQPAAGDAASPRDPAPAQQAPAPPSAAKHGAAADAGDPAGPASGQADAPAADVPAPGSQPEAAPPPDASTPGAPRQQAALPGGTPGAPAAAGTPQPSPKAQADAAAPPVAIQAVEIEGRRIFVAGSAEPGRSVRVYANEILLGQSRASQAGRFLIEAERELAVGDYIIRADMLADDAATVLARAAVPFTREEGEFVAAVAPSAPAPDNPVAEARSSPADAGPATQPSAPAQAQAEQQSSGPAQPSAGATPPAPSLTPAPQPPAAAAEADAGPDAPAAGPATVDEGRGDRIASRAPDPAQPSEAAAPVASASAGDSGDRMAAAPAQAGQASPEPVLAPKLEPVKSTVIIRRGDTLWRISRRVYGRGVRYSTIYLANQDQIEDPDRIWPGQVFTVPEETDEGEKADMSSIADQATTAQP